MNNKQIKKEAIVTIVLYLIYFAWWYYFAYIYCPSDVEDYTYVLGMPAWFFYSCVVGLVVMNILVYIAVKVFFKDMDLDEYDNKNIKVEEKEKNE